MTVNRRWHKDQVRKYKAELPIYRQYAATLQLLFEKACQLYAPLAIVQSRPKSLSSFAEKAIRKAFKYQAPVTQLTDLCGARIITSTVEEARRIGEFIRAHFIVDEANSLDVRTRLRPSEFGYLSFHYVVQTKGREILGVEIPDEIGGRKAEIQVRTLLQHAWASITHDRLYKGSFQPPSHLHRDLARVAAFLEKADDEFDGVVRKIEAYKLDYGAYLSPDQRREEGKTLRCVLENEPEKANRPSVALRLALLAKSEWDWEAIVAALDPFIAAKSRETPEILLEHGRALCELHRTRPTGREAGRGRKELRAASASEERRIRSQALSCLAQSHGRGPGGETKAREIYRRAHETAPENPYILSGWLEYELACRKDPSALPLLRPTLLSAVNTCRLHADLGLELPWAHFTAARLHLLLDEPYESLSAYAKAVHFLTVEHPSGGAEMIGAEIAFLHHVGPALKNSSGHRWADDLIRLARAVIAPVPEHLDDLKRRAKRRPAFPRPILVVAGGAGRESDAEGKTGRDLLAAALRDFKGTLISGGTSQGIPGAETEFSPAEPLQYWIDLVASGVPPSEVKVLAIGGGVITAFECRLALGLGSTVGLLGSRGHAAAELARDAPAWREGRLLVIPEDAQAAHAYVRRVASRLRRQDVEKIGRAIHRRFLRENRYQSADPAMRDWSDLREDFKESNRQQAACAEEILRAAGYGVRAAAKSAGAIAFPTLSEAEVETMAEMEHGRWIIERLRSGWAYGPAKDSARKKSPFLAPWEDLAEEVKDYDRKAVRDWPEVFAAAGFEIFKRPPKSV
jgi:ppGpp synthetase/RelA/SpoT-type nucleotidyltranferase